MFRSILFVPATRPDRIPKAIATGADAISIDLEDAVPADQKEAARKILSQIPPSTQTTAVCVRINHPGGENGRRDLQALAAADRMPAYLLVPKVEAIEDLEVILSTPGSAPPLLAIIESARGLQNAAAIASHPAVCALLFGSADYAADIGSTMGWDALLYARGKLVATAAAHGKPALDGVWLDINDSSGLTHDTKRIKALGFTGRAAIHPKQISGIHTGFAPTDAEVGDAKAVVSAFESAGGKAILVGSRMIDRPVYEAAVTVISRAAD